MCTIKYGGFVVPGRVELPTSTLSVWRSNQLSYRTEAGTVSETFVFNGLLWGNHICEKQGVENPLFCRFLPLTRLWTSAPERRCSSRTFRYGYLVTP